MGFALLLEKLGGKPGCLEGFLNRIKAFLTLRIGMGRLLPQCCFISGKGDSYLGLAVVLLEGQSHDMWGDKHIWIFPNLFFSAGSFRFQTEPSRFFCPVREGSIPEIKERDLVQRVSVL